MGSPISPELERQLAEAARPLFIDLGGGNRIWTRGLSRREEFAKAAMTGLLAQETADNRYATKEYLVRDAVQLADALLAELERTAK